MLQRAAGRFGPAQRRGAPGQAAAEGQQNDQVAGANPPLLIGLVEGHRHRGGGGGGVPVALYFEEELLPRLPQPFCGGVDDADVGLVGNETAHLVEREPRALRRGLDGAGDAAPGELVDLPAVHVNEVLLPLHGLETGGAGGAARGGGGGGAARGDHASPPPDSEAGRGPSGPGTGRIRCSICAISAAIGSTI